MSDDPQHASSNPNSSPQTQFRPPHLVRESPREFPAIPHPASIEGVFHLMTNAIPQLVWRSAPDGTIDFLSDQWYDFTGLNPDSQRRRTLHQDWRSAIHEDDAPAFFEHWNRCVKSHQRFEAECRIHRAAEGYCWHLCRANPVCDKLGRVLSWYGTSTYIDAQKLAHESLVAAGRAKDRFLAMLSHELRTPLTPALLIVAELEADPALSPHLLAIVRDLRRNLLHEARLVNDLFDISAALSGKLTLHCEATDMRAMVMQALDVCRPDLDAKNISVSLTWNVAPLAVVADPNRLQQILWNLLRNAAKFTPDGGTVEITASQSHDSFFRISIKDNGIGIAPHDIARVFAPFVQIGSSHNAMFGGLGLGLAIARNIAELHQGTLIALSDGLGHGTTFVLEIPTLPAARSLLPQDPEPAPPPRTIRSLAILLVEDHLDTARAMSRLLQALGHQVNCAQTAADGLARARSASFDLLLSDLSLPDQSGWDFLGDFRKISSAPAIALSGFGSDDDVIRSRNVGFFRHLTKPVDADTLRATIAQIAPSP